MNRVYMFDVDGTLTKARQQMTENFAKFFDKWSSKNKYYLVTGSDLPKLKEQIPIAYIDRAQGVFTCCGNQFYTNKDYNLKLEYENKFNPPEDLIDYLKEQLEDTNYSVKTGNHIENRGSMINFSVIGRNCNYEQRLDYYDWDKENNERKKIVKGIEFGWPDLDAVIGGQISIDIYPKGMDKSQILKHIEKIENFYCPDEYIFIGDKMREGGNDYPLAKIMYETSNCSALQTLGPENTQQYLEKLSD
tara:strand:- start:27 stop:767 length:741 start_codon:yes stop_codon:yes gene_type:complete